MPYSRTRTLERLFRGEHPDSGRHIGIPRRIPRVLPLSCPTPIGVVEAPRELKVCARTPPLSGGLGVVASALSCASPLSRGPVVSATHVACPLPNGSVRVPGSSSLAVTAQVVDSTSSSSSAIPPSLLEVSLQRAAVRVAAKATTSVEGRPRSLVPPVLLHPSASLGLDPCLGSRPGSVGVAISRRGRFRF